MDNKSIISKYRMVYDHHTHTTYSHGKGSILDNARVAHEKGLKSIAITDHGPGNFLYGMKGGYKACQSRISGCKGILRSGSKYHLEGAIPGRKTFGVGETGHSSGGISLRGDGRRYDT